MLLDGKQRAGLNEVVTVVFHEVFDSLTGFGTLLNLVEDNDGLTFVEADTIDELKLSEEMIAVGDVGNSLPDRFGSIGKIDNDIASVLTAGKLFGNG